MQLPQMYRIRQTFDAPQVEDVEREVDQQLARLDLGSRIQPGETVAITAGSRGIANIAAILRATVAHLRRCGAEPFIVPAMGSHGGGTAAGQTAILHGFGITQDSVGCPIRASMATVVVAETPQGVPVHFDRLAYEADHVLVCGRIKPHTGFAGEIESGLHKMMLIGLGKHEGAKIYHRAVQDFPFIEIVTAVGQLVIEKCRVLAGLGIVENAYDQTGCIAAVPPEEFFEREKELLTLAKAWLPRLPFPDVHLLIVDRIGKDISGTGMDTNVIGRKYNDHAAGPDDLARCKRIYVRGLTEATKGNATGLGMAEYTNARTVAAVNEDVTRINCITGLHPSAAAIPITFDDDRVGIPVALTTVGFVEPAQAKVIQIPDTLHLAEVLVSAAYEEELREREDLTILDGPAPMQFDASGHLLDV